MTLLVDVRKLNTSARAVSVVENQHFAMAEDDVVAFEGSVLAGFAIEDAGHLQPPVRKHPPIQFKEECTVIALQDDIPQTLNISPEAIDLDTSHFLAYCPMIDSISSSILSSLRFSSLVFLIIAKSSLSLAFQYLIKSLSLVIHSSLVLSQKLYTKRVSNPLKRRRPQETLVPVTSEQAHSQAQSQMLSHH